MIRTHVVEEVGCIALKGRVGCALSRFFEAKKVDLTFKSLSSSREGGACRTKWRSGRGGEGDPCLSKIVGGPARWHPHAFCQGRRDRLCCER